MKPTCIPLRCFAVLSFLLAQAAFAASVPTGRFVPDGAERGGGAYVVGDERTVLSRENVRLYEKAASGDAVAQYEFAKVLDNPNLKDVGDNDSPRMAAEAFAWAMRSARQGNADGENYIGVCYESGNGIPKNLKKAERWFVKATEHGSAKAMANLANLHIGNGHAEKAVPLARKSALLGCAWGQFIWGKMHFQGLGTPVDYEKAAVWYDKAARQGEADAVRALGVCYQFGMGRKRDVAKAVELYGQALERAGGAFQKALARVALASTYIDTDDAEAKTKAFECALGIVCNDNGDLSALEKRGQKGLIVFTQYIVGLAYAKGEGVEKDEEQAKYWLGVAAGSGELRAKAALSEIEDAQRRRQEQILAAKMAKEEAERRLIEAERRRAEERRQRESDERTERLAEYRERLRRRQKEEKRASLPQLQTGAEEAVREMLTNVRRRYKSKLARYELTESYFDETIGICDLMLLDVQRWIKFQIVYYRNSGYIEWPRTMPKSVAEDLMEDRLLIHAYEKALENSNRP